MDSENRQTVLREKTYWGYSGGRRFTPRIHDQKEQQECDGHQKNTSCLCEGPETESDSLRRGSFKVNHYLKFIPSTISLEIFSIYKQALMLL